MRLGVRKALALASVAVLTGAASAQAAPNIVLVLTDDQRWDTLGVMPTVQRELVRRGVTFANTFAVDPLCCPSRASLLTGNYPHTTGVWWNGGAGAAGMRSATTRHRPWPSG